MRANRTVSLVCPFLEDGVEGFEWMAFHPRSLGAVCRGLAVLIDPTPNTRYCSSVAFNCGAQS